MAIVRRASLILVCGLAACGGPGEAGRGGTVAVSGTAEYGSGRDSAGGEAGARRRAVPRNVPPSDRPAFPGAEGFGARAWGGRGGRVIKVTTLAARGPGSLQHALDQEGPRIIVFDVSGAIESDVVISTGYVTIAGQTAPGAGITIRGRLYTPYRYGVDNIVIRHVRVRPEYDGSDGAQFDAVQLSRSRLVMLDHMSIGFGVDETVDLYEAKDVTVQYSTIESSYTRGHPERGHNYGLINGPDGRRISVHHNLFAHHKNRCPAIANGPAEVRSNVVYNVRHGFVHHNPASGPFNIVGNYYRAGGDDTLIPFWFDDEAGFSARDLSYYLRDNYVDDPKSRCRGRVVQNPWRECRQDLFAAEKQRAVAEFDFTGLGKYWLPVTTHGPEETYRRVLAEAGAFPRDAVTLRSVAETRGRGGRWGARVPKDLMAGLRPSPAPADRDGDGMADDWERARGLDPSDPRDHATVLRSGYAAIEEYIDQLADARVAAGRAAAR